MHPPYGKSGQPYGAGREAVGRLRPPLHLRLFGHLATLGNPNRCCSATVANSLSPRCSPRYRFSLFAPTCSPVRECLRSILHSRHSRHTPPHVSHPPRKQPLSAPQPSEHRPRPKPRRAARLRHTLITATRPTSQTVPGSLWRRASGGREIAALHFTYAYADTSRWSVVGNAPAQFRRQTPYRFRLRHYDTPGLLFAPTVPRSFGRAHLHSFRPAITAPRQLKAVLRV